MDEKIEEDKRKDENEEERFHYFSFEYRGLLSTFSYILHEIKKT